jgi:hypothetical protein
VISGGVKYIRVDFWHDSPSLFKSSILQRFKAGPSTSHRNWNFLRYILQLILAASDQLLLVELSYVDQWFRTITSTTAGIHLINYYILYLKNLTKYLTHKGLSTNRFQCITPTPPHEYTSPIQGDRLRRRYPTLCDPLISPQHCVKLVRPM